MLVVSRVGFLRSNLILAVLKDAGMRPEVRGVDKEWQDVIQNYLEKGGRKSKEEEREDSRVLEASSVKGDGPTQGAG